MMADHSRAHNSRHRSPAGTANSNPGLLDALFVTICMSATDIPDLSATVAQTAAATLAADCSEVIEWRAEHGTIRTHGAHGWPSPPHDCKGDDLVNRVMVQLEHQPEVAINDPLFPYGGSHPLAAQLKGATLVAAIQHADRTWGMLAVHTRAPREFTRQEFASAHAMACLFSSALGRIHPGTGQQEPEEAAERISKNLLGRRPGRGDCAHPTEAAPHARGETTSPGIESDPDGAESMPPRNILIPGQCDITSCQRANERFASLMANLPGWAYRARLSPTFALDYLYKGEVDFLGWSEAELNALLNDDFGSVILSPSRQSFMDTLESAVPNTSYLLILRLKAKAGDIRIVETRGRVLRNGGGAVEAVEGVAFDITDQMYQQEQLDQARRMQTVGSLAAGITHDFNNLLQSITGYCRVLSTNPSLDGQARQDLEEVERGAHRASSLVRRLMNVSRHTPSNMEFVDMVFLAQEAIGLLREAIPRTIDIEFHGPESPVFVIGDSSQLNQVLMNLCLNARDAMPDGGLLSITVKGISAKNRTAKSVHGLSADHLCWCCVTDTGCGMNPETAGRAIEPFFTTKPEGTGLGLSTCYGIVKCHDGKLTIQSAVNQGTQVSIFLPLADATEAGNGPALRPASVSGTETILVVDDEAPIRRLTARLLRGQGYNVLTADNGRHAVEEAASYQGKLDLVLLDLNMPEMDGQRAMESLRQHAPQAKILVLTGLDTTVESCDPSGRPDALLHKPCSPAALLQALRRLLDTNPLVPPG